MKRKFVQTALRYAKRIKPHHVASALKFAKSAYGHYKGHSTALVKHERANRFMDIGDAASAANGISSRSYKLKIFKKPRSFRSKQKSKYTEVYGNVFENQAGIQGWNDVVFMGTATQFMGSPTNLLHQNPMLGNSPYIDFNPTTNYVGNQVFNGAARYNNETTCLDSCQCELTIRNVTSNDAFVQVMVLKCQDWTNREPAVAFELAQDVTDGGQSFAPQPGPGSSTGAGIGKQNRGTIGNNAQAFKEFNREWKCIKKCYLNLSAGAVERVLYKIDYNLVQGVPHTLQRNPGLPVDRPGAPGWVSGNFNVKYGPGCLAVVIIQQGAPVVDATNPTQKATIGVSKIAVIVRKSHTFSFMRERDALNNINLVYNELSAGATNPNQKIINDEDAAVAIQSV